MNLEKQKLFVEYLISSQEVFIKINSILNVEYFDVSLRPAIKFIKGYFDEYRAMPSPEQLYAESEVKSKTKDLTRKEIEYSLNEMEKFCKNKAIENAILKSVNLLEEENYGLIESSIRTAVITSLNRNIGIDYFSNPEARLLSLLTSFKPLSTGWKDLDTYLGGGINRKELTLFAGNPGKGKSLMMANLAVNLMHQKYDVVYITLELSEEVVSKRFDSMITGISQGDILKNIKATSYALSNVKEKMGSLVVKRMPESTTNCNHIRAFLSDYEIIYGKMPDALVVDYLDLLATNQKVSVENLFIKDKYTTEELRSIMNEYNIAGVSASQLGRASVNASLEDHNQGHIQGGMSKVNTCDNLIAIIQSEAMKMANEFIFKLLKTRSSAGVGYHLPLKFDPVSLRVLNGDGSDILGKYSHVELEKEMIPVDEDDILKLLNGDNF